MTELLNCPFCGGSVSFAPYKNNGLKIECKPCTISYQQRTLRYGLDWLEGKMTEHWNRRAHLGCESCDGGMIDCYVCPLCAAASARPIGEDAANVAIGERGRDVDIADFLELIDAYQCAQKDGTHDERAQARIALMDAYRAALTAALEKGDARDAERYRWLRDFNVRCKDGVNINPPCEHVHASMYSHAVGTIPAVRLVTGEELDRAIDAALSQKAGEQQ